MQREQRRKSSQAHMEWAAHHVAPHYRDSHCFGVGFSGGRHEQVRKGEVDVETFESMGKPLATSTPETHTQWRDDPRALVRERKGRPKGERSVFQSPDWTRTFSEVPPVPIGVEGIEREGIDFDGDGVIGTRPPFSGVYAKREEP